MGRQSSCEKPKLRKGLWSPEEDEKLFNYITRFGVGCWSTVPKLAGLQRCGKSCRLRWINYLRPNLKRGMFSQQEEDLIISLHQALGNRWAQIAAQLPGRTDNEIKNFWNSYLKKKLMKQGIDPNTHKPLSETETETIDGNNNNNSNSTEKSSSSSLAAAAAAANLLQFKGLPTGSTSAEMAQFHGINNASYNNYEGTGILTRDQFESKPIFNPIFGYDQLIQPGADDPTGYNSNLLTQYQNHHLHEVMNHNFGFNSMPSLTNFGPGNVGEVDFSDNSGPRMSSYSVNEGKDQSLSNMLISSFQMNNNDNNNNLVDQNAEFSWGTDKLESVFQCQFTGIKSEEIVKSSPWPEAHNSEAFSSCYSLMSLSEDLAGASMGGFQQI